MPFNHLPELLIIMVVALIVFGPQRLPEVGASVGKAMREFRRATSEIEEAVMHRDEPEEEGMDELSFPHIPPAPDVSTTEPVIATVDTLSERREARLRARQAAAMPGSAEVETPPS
jgi:TatA/E family protein of Tat protein translocase